MVIMSYWLTSSFLYQKVCIMFNKSTLSLKTPYKCSINVVVSALALMTISSLSQAASSHSPDSYATTAMITPATYCTSDIEAQTSHPKYQSAQQRAIDCMQTQLRTYQGLSMTARQQYFGFKAQAWLNYAYFEESIKSSSMAGTQAIQAGAAILKALQSGEENELSLITDIPSTSALMRPDIWAQISALKDTDGIGSAPRELAFSEVSLVWAATDYCARDQKQSASRFRMADRWIEQAREAFVNAHDSTTNVALEDLSVRYFKQYELSDPSDNICRGQSMILNDQNMANIYIVPLAQIATLPTPTITYTLK